MRFPVIDLFKNMMMIKNFPHPNPRKRGKESGSSGIQELWLPPLRIARGRAGVGAMREHKNHA
jgi:hypothetical protein